MPSLIQIHRVRGEAQAVRVEPGHTRELLIPEMKPGSLLVRCSVLDLYTNVYVWDEPIDLSQPYVPAKPEEDRLELESIARLEDGQPPIDIATLGIPVPEHHVVLSHFNSLLARN